MKRKFKKLKWKVKNYMNQGMDPVTFLIWVLIGFFVLPLVYCIFN